MFLPTGSGDICKASEDIYVAVAIQRNLPEFSIEPTIALETHNAVTD